MLSLQRVMVVFVDGGGLMGWWGVCPVISECYILINLFQSNSMIYPTAPAYSLKARNKTHQNPPTPSPDAYSPNLTNTLSKSPTWKLGKQLRRQTSIKKIPSPNSYEPHPIHKSRTFGVIGHEKRLRQVISSTPGPGSYETCKNKQNIAASFPQQPKCIISINAFPGPGAYDPCLRKERTGIKMTRQARFATDGHREVSPGPADYQCLRSNSGSLSFGRAQRISEPKIISNHTGPGQYHFSSTFEENVQGKKGYTIAARHTTKDQRCSSPGPANYSPTYRDLPTSPTITISRKYKERPSQRSPSPNQYHPQSFLATTKAESFSIGKAEKLALRVDSYIPGPGAYLKTEYISTGVSISLGKSRKHEENEEIPGPGAYNPRSSAIQQRPKSAKIGLSKRFQKLNTEISPSPGFYQSNVSIFDNPRYSFPKKKRLSLKKECLPGPGTYNIPGTLCRATVK